LALHLFARIVSLDLAVFFTLGSDHGNSSVSAIAGNRPQGTPECPRSQFAADSPLEGDGFEPSVPRQIFLGKKEFGTDALTGRSADRSNAGDLPGPCAYYRAMLINDLADIDNEVFVFLDDYHLVTDPAIRRAVSFLLRHAPSHLHLVLTTRLEPPLSLGGLLAKNRLLEVDASVLRFDYFFARPISSRGACLHPPRADGTVRDV
jgi:hypothetical protein